MKRQTQISNKRLPFNTTKGSIQKKKKKDDVRKLCLKLFEDLRKSSCPASKRLKIIDKLSSALRGRINQVIFSHDMSRIVQCMLKKGNADNTSLIVKEIVNNSSELAKNKYSNHVLKALVRHCSASVKRQLNKTLMKDTISLLRCKNSAPLISELYINATASEKRAFRRSICGDEHRLLDASSSLKVLTENEQKFVSKSLNKKNLWKLLEKDWCLKYSIVTSTLSSYLLECSDDDRTEFFDHLKFHILELITTNEGCSVAMNILRNSTAKEKKAIVKQLKHDFLQVATKKSGSFFLLSLIDCVDDTVLIKKEIIAKINEYLLELLMCNNGRRLIAYIFLHREALFFSPKELNALQMADQAKHVKKSSQQKVKELREYCIKNLLNCIKTNPEKWVLNGPASIIAAAVLQQAADVVLDIKEDTQAAFISISKFIVKSGTEFKAEDSETNLFECSCVHSLMKKLILNDHARYTKNLGTFTSCLLSQLNKETITTWIKVNRGCFCLIWILELTIDPFTRYIHKCFTDEKVQEVLNIQKSPGSKLLKEKLSVI